MSPDSPTPDAEPAPAGNGPGTTSTPPPGGNGADPAAASPDQVRQLQQQRDEYLDQLQRTRAEFSNYQKRARAQAEADRQYAVVPLASDLLAVLDNFERTIEAARAAGAPGIVSGMEMVARQLSDALAKHGIEPIPALGRPFDPNVHEAIAQQPDAEHPEGTIVTEHGKGYRLRDRVLRPSKVAVSVRPQG